LKALGCAVYADIAGVDAPVVKSDEKRLLLDARSSVAVDMESHVAGEAAEAHGMPFAACRVILEPAYRTQPPAALIDLRPDGTADVAAVLRSVIATDQVVAEAARPTCRVSGWTPDRQTKTTRSAACASVP
jgi:adenosylhomocysteine nucleosidase